MSIKMSCCMVFRFSPGDTDLAKFGASYLGGGPSPLPPSVVEEGQAPVVDRTYKLYYGGAQKRPDAGYCRTICDAKGNVFALVGEANRLVLKYKYKFKKIQIKYKFKIYT